MSAAVLGAAGACMGVSTIAFNAMAKEETKRFNYVAMAVTGIATLAYLCMTYNVGVAQVDGHPVYYARYLDWFFTTPFFLLDLSLLAGADTWSTFYVMLLNALCIAAGAIGALNPRVGWPCFIFGMVTFVMFNAQLFGTMLTKAGELGADVQNKYKLVTAFAMGLWWAYPILFYFFELTHTFGVETEIWCYAILDVSAKCVASFILLSDHTLLDQTNKAKGYKEGLLA
jgi:bacteriorhodopsin